MVADAADIQVWIDTHPAHGAQVMTPYVKSAENRSLQYRVRVVKSGSSGRSELQQGGSVNVFAGADTALGKMTLTLKEGDDCEIEVVHTEHGHEDTQYRFDCPS